MSITQLEGLFGEGHRETARAYVLAHAMVRDFLQTYGPGVVRRILAGMSSGATFDQAFITATGTTVSGATRAFWRRTNSWEQWVTFAASPFTLWSLMTGLSLAAIWRHRRRRAEKRRSWEAEERAEAEAWEEHRRKYRLH